MEIYTTLAVGYAFYYLAASIGISAGYHRYFSHRSYKVSPSVEVIMLFFGLICGGRSALTWAAVHRMHHAKTDTDKDPHSPLFVGKWKVIFSRWKLDYIPKKYIVDMLKNKRIVFFHRYGKYIHLAYALFMLVIGVDFFIAFVVMPYVISWIGFGTLNWITHYDGKVHDFPIMNIIAPGEGWHKYHHENPMKYSLHKMDPVGYLIAAMKRKTQ